MTTNDPQGRPTLAQAIEQVAGAVMGARRGPTPARVVAYLAPDRCDVQLVLAEAEDVDPPIVRNVPIAYPMSAVGGVHFPLSVGDVVFLVPAERSLDEWALTGAEGQVPRSPRSFALSDVVAVPSIRALANPPLNADGVSTVVSGTLVKLGGPTAAVAVALATLVEAELSALWLALNTHVHASNGTPPTGAPLGTAGSVGASKVVAE